MANLKQTQYFLSDYAYSISANHAFQKVIGMRDEFIKEKNDLISEVVSEKIDFFPGDNGNKMYVMLTLSFYLK